MAVLLDGRWGAPAGDWAILVEGLRTIYPNNFLQIKWRAFEQFLKPPGNFSKATDFACPLKKTNGFLADEEAMMAVLVDGRWGAVAGDWAFAPWAPPLLRALAALQVRLSIGVLFYRKCQDFFLRKVIPAQIRQLILYISNDKG